MSSDLEEGGLRFPFNVLPTNRIDASLLSLPIGCLYSPLYELKHQPCTYEPVTCQTCGAILNPYCEIDFSFMTWSCSLCRTRSNLPTGYSGMTPDCIAAELHKSMSTIEYTLGKASFPPIFVLVVDCCARASEHQHLKTLLVKTIASLPRDAMVGFVSFGSIAYIHELTFSECPRSYVFNGVKTYEVEKMREFLNVNVNDSNPFIVPVNDAEQMITKLVDDLEAEEETGVNTRPDRCTGAAIDYAISLLGACCPRRSAHIMLFASGAATKGPGVIATTKKSEPVRQHRDIESGKATMTTSALKYYKTLKRAAVRGNLVVDVIAAGFEEMGLYEMGEVVRATGGFVVLGESWSDECIGGSLVKFFDGGVLRSSGYDLRMGLKVTNEIKIKGCVGPCVSAHRRNATTSEKVVGEGMTSEWRMCSALSNTTFAFFLDVEVSKAQPIPAGTTAYLQFTTRYTHVGTGTIRLRVTTAPVTFASISDGKEVIASGFDQEAATVLTAKYAMWETRSQECADVVHMIDRMLIRFCRLFGTYTKGDALSFALDERFRQLPQFIYHLRRSPFLSTFNSSPDQATSLRHALMCEDIPNSLFMIQPTLMRYALDQTPNAVILDLGSIAPDNVLVLDTFFKVIVWHGEKIAAWRNERYQEEAQYANLKLVLEAPIEEARGILADRFPMPVLIVCDQGSSGERGLLARCNPSSMSGIDPYFGGENLSTDEASLWTFFDKLKQMAVVTA